MQTIRKIKPALLLLLAASILPFACAQPERNQAALPQVVATTSFVSEIVGKVGGDRIELSTLIPRGKNPHNYEPEPRQAAQIEAADLVFVNGFGLEESALELIEAAANGRVVNLSQAIHPLESDEHEDHEHEHEHEAGDPHVWTSPRLLLFWVDAALEALSSQDPAGLEYYQANAQAVRQELEQLDAQLAAAAAQLPASKRILVGGHLALGYFARDYGLSIGRSFEAPGSHQSESSARYIAQVAQYIRDSGTEVIFIDRAAGQSLQQTAKLLQSEIGQSLRLVEIMFDSLAPLGTAGSDYAGFVQGSLLRILEELDAN